MGIHSVSPCRAAAADADVIAFCGVHFMAETASILSPGKTVLLPDLDAGCSLADSITADQLGAWKMEHPGALVVQVGRHDPRPRVKAEQPRFQPDLVQAAVQVVEHICREHGVPRGTSCSARTCGSALTSSASPDGGCRCGTASVTSTPATPAPGHLARAREHPAPSS